MADRPAGTARHVNSLAEIVLSEESLDSLLGHIGRLGVAALDGWDAAATSVVDKGRIASYGITDDRINVVDQFQYDTAAGPCVDAVADDDFKYFGGSEVPASWEDFARVAADADVRSTLSFPLKHGDVVLGGINFYSSRRDALKPGQREDGWVFATQAAIALANQKEFAAARRQAAQLEEGLQTRTLIGQATGLLMAQEGMRSDEAFQKLVQVSQKSNIKLRDIAARYVETWEEKART